jgi:hypothetical protein
MASLTRTIEIDFDVHRHIEAARQGFDDPPNAVLRRLLGINNNDTGSQENSSATPGAASTDLGVPWTRKGILLPGGTELQVRYAEVKADGRVTGGKLVLNGKEFDAPSKAVIEVVAQHRGSPVSINGWKHLYARQPGHRSWMSLDHLRATRQAESMEEI